MESELVREFIRNRDVLTGFVHALTGDHEAAEEVFQDLAVSIVNEAQRGTRPQRFLPWARALARNRAADFYRRRARQGRHLQAMEDFTAAVAHAFEDHQIGAEEASRRLRFLRECLAELGAKARRIVELRYHGGRSLRDVAAAVAWKESAVKVALSKARRALGACVRGKLAAAGDV